jgi:predicted acylesterase/phospholipase RssA
MKRALVLAAGGVTGALYEVGVLRAIEGRHGPLQQLFDLFIGVSAGATVATFVSQGVSAVRLHSALLAGDDPFFPLRQRDIAAMDLHRAAKLAATAARFAAHALRRLLRPGSPARSRPGPALPSGLLSIEPYRRFVAETLRASGLSDHFRSLPRPLLVPATDLDSARRVVFGEPPWDDVPISTAVAASSAIPTFFEPVTLRGRHLVDGNVGKVAHLDLAVARGVRRVLVVSPLAPVENGAGPCVVPGEDGTCRSLSERGFWAIHNQAFRIENQVRLHLGIGKFLSETPGLRVDLLEPDPADATLFLANPMSLAARREILEGAYAQARRALDGRRVGAVLAA